MRRREFMGACAGAAVTAAGRTSASTAMLPPNPPADTDGVPFTLTVMLWTVYRDLPFPQRLEKVAEAGYHAVELVDEFKNWKPQDFAEARRKKRELGIEIDGTCGWSCPEEMDMASKPLGARGSQKNSLRVSDSGLK